MGINNIDKQQKVNKIFFYSFARFQAFLRCYRVLVIISENYFLWSVLRLIKSQCDLLVLYKSCEIILSC